MSLAFAPPGQLQWIKSTSHVNSTSSHERTNLVRRRSVWKCTDKPTEEAPKQDLVTRIWTGIFGAKQEEPFGLKRFDRDRFPELYYATLDEFAPPMESDDELAACFRPLLARTQLESRAVQLLYDANRDGWSAEAYHSKVDKKGCCVVVATTEGGAVCGGYSPKGFVGYGESRGSKAAFMFTWPDGDLTKPALKMRKVGGNALAVIDQPDTGPRFGSGELYIPLRPPRATWESDIRDKRAMSKLGSYYEKKPDGGNCLFADGESGKGTLLIDLKVYAGVYAEGEEIPFDDAVPFALE